MISPEESRFDEELRRRLADFEATPPSSGWSTLQQNLPTPPVQPGLLARLRPFGAGVVAGALLWWGGARLTNPATHSTAVPPAQEVTVVASAPQPQASSALTTKKLPTSTISEPTTSPAAAAVAAPAAVSSQLLTGAGAAIASASPVSHVGAAASTPAKSRVQATPNSHLTLPVPVVASALETPSAAVSSAHEPSATATGNGLTLSPSVRQIVALDTAMNRALQAAGGSPAGRNTRLGELLTEQQAALTTFQHHLDSLKESLLETPPTLANGADSAAQPAQQPADNWRKLPAPRNPWAVVALLETTPHWSVLPTQGPTPDQEQTQAALAQSLQLQRQIGTNWRLRGGFGQASLQTQARYTSARSGERTTIDSSATVTTVEVTRHEDYITIIRVDSVMRYEPILNGNGQVIGYDTIWVAKNDTLVTPRVTFDTTTKIVKTYKQTTEKWTERRQQLLRPEYRFWTIPLNVQYLLVNRNRWSLGLSLGTQITVFRGGTRPVWNGDEYVMRRVSPRDGPYRPVSFSLSTGLEAQYRLTPRLSVLAAPTLRWWAVPAAKGPRSTARTLLPAGQIGLSYGLW